MQPKSLFQIDSPVASRQPKTDRLILANLLKSASTDKRMDQDELKRSHQILIKWADLDSSGRLAKLNETQMQGDFLAEVFGAALGYVGPLDGAETWNRDQHHSIAGQTPDAILGVFRPNVTHQPLAVVELKGPTVRLDRDRSNGRTAIDQCWDYLVNTPPACRWGIVSNFVSFRLYERDSTKRVYEHFSLQSLRDPAVFNQFYFLFHRQGLVEKAPFYDAPRAAALLKRTVARQREVGDKLYDTYSSNRTELISYLHFKRKHSLNDSIEMAQRLFDRIMFIAFCEDRSLLPENTIPKAYTVAGFHAVTNPRWQNFKHLFRFIDEGSQTHDIPRYNGGLFAKHAVDDLELPDSPWTTFFHSISTYDFADEVNLDVLGHLFERSITELEKLKESGLFGGDPEKTHQFATMPQSAKRKQLGIYYTPPELTSRIVQYTVEELIAQRFAAAAIVFGVPEADAARGVTPDNLLFWQRCLDILRNLKVVDPACGSGAFLFQAYDALELRYLEVLGQLERTGDPEAANLAAQVPHYILQENLHGVDLSPEAVEITQLALWIRSAAPGHTLATLSANIVHGNSLVHDPNVHPAGFDWRERFPQVFNREEAGFDCVIGNPPWERIKLQEREFFSMPAPEIATSTNAAKRRKLVAKLEADNPGLYQRYQDALKASDSVLTYCRKSEKYPLTGKGDINTYAVFAELAQQLVSPHGFVGLLLPTALTTTMTTKDFFGQLVDSRRLFRLYDFSNRKAIFADLERRQNFAILCFGGSEMNAVEADFVFRSLAVDEVEDPQRHIRLPSDAISLVNPNTKTAPVFKTSRDAKLTYQIYKRVPVLIDNNRKGPTANPWGVSFKRMFDQTNDAGYFHEADELTTKGFELKGNRWVKDKETFLPLYEAKMCRPFDHRHGSVVINEAAWYMQGRSARTSLVQHQNPEYLVLPRYWVDEATLLKKTPVDRHWFLGFRDVARNDDTRTFLANAVPLAAVINKLPLLLTTQTAPREMCLLGNLSAFVFDYIVRQKLGDVSMNFFIVEQLPTLTPDTYAKPCPWDRSTTLESWISERVLKLTCTAEDMLPLADACHFTSGSFQTEYGGRLNKWDEAERAELMADLDAAFFHLYGINRDDMEYILTTFKGIDDPRPHFPGHVSTATRITQKYAELSFPA